MSKQRMKVKSKERKNEEINEWRLKRKKGLKKRTKNCKRKSKGRWGKENDEEIGNSIEKKKKRRG